MHDDDISGIDGAADVDRSPFTHWTAIGLSGAAGLTRVLETMLFGVKPSDAVTFLGVTLVIGVVATVACVVPAWRAARGDPLVALRHE